MRVIAGAYRSRPLAAPRGDSTRPTSDRLRETLFNILAPRIASARFADLYAGTGAVGIEALSRGASQVYFAEKAAPALAALRANLASLGLDSAIASAIAIAIEPRGVSPLLDRIARSGSPLDLVFLDPPWDATREYTATLETLGGSLAPKLLAPGALVIAEHSSKSPLPPRYGALTRTRTLRQGDATLTFYAIEP